MKKTFLRNKLPKKNRYTYFYCVTCCCCRSLADKLSQAHLNSVHSAGTRFPARSSNLRSSVDRKTYTCWQYKENYLTETNPKKDKETRTWTWYHSQLLPVVNHSNGGTTNKDVLSDVQSDALHYTLPCLSTGQSLPGSQANEQSVQKAILYIKILNRNTIQQLKQSATLKNMKIIKEIMLIGSDCFFR